MGKKLIIANIILLIIGLPIQAQADFSSDEIIGCDSLTVQFFDLSIGATSWLWDFGDGTTSTQETPPPHVYSSPGYYDVTLTINGSDQEKKENYIRIISTPDPSFSYSDTLGLDAFTYVFRNPVQQFESDIDYVRDWSISDGSSYSTREFVHTFDDIGLYQIELDIYVDLLPQCSSSSSQSLPIYALADFNANTTIGCDTLTVQFSDLSTGASSWEWNFGDGTTSSEQNPPPHFYSSPGIYDVTLTINESVFETKQGYISVIPKPDSSFWYSDTLDAASLTYVFHSPVQESENNFDYNRSWLISDGGAYSTREFAHTFSDTGLYDIELEVSADLLPQCSSSSEQTILVKDEIYVPNVFSPNGEGPNELFIVEYNSTTNLSIFIYSRYGVLVFKTTAPVIVWDGVSLNGQIMNEGVYYYLLTSDDGEISKTGFIHLYR